MISAKRRGYRINAIRQIAGRLASWSNFKITIAISLNQVREYLTGFNIFSTNVIIMTAGDRFSLIAQLTSSLALDEKFTSFFDMFIAINFFLPIQFYNFHHFLKFFQFSIILLVLVIALWYFTLFYNFV